MGDNYKRYQEFPELAELCLAEDAREEVFNQLLDIEPWYSKCNSSVVKTFKHGIFKDYTLFNPLH